MADFNDAMAGNQDKELTSADKWLEQSILELCAMFKLEVIYILTIATVQQL